MGIVLTAKLVQTVYGNLATVFTPSTAFVYSNPLSIFMDNVRAFVGLNWNGPEYQNPALFLLPLLFALTPSYPRILPRDADRIVRVSIALFLLGSLVLSQVRESRVLLEFVLAIMVPPLLVRFFGESRRASR